MVAISFIITRKNPHDLVHDLYLEFQNLWFSERGKTWNRKQIPHLDFSN